MEEGQYSEAFVLEQAQEAYETRDVLKLHLINWRKNDEKNWSLCLHNGDVFVFKL